jgi:uncharacterized membrane protein YqiK
VVIIVLVVVIVTLVAIVALVVIVALVFIVLVIKKAEVNTRVKGKHVSRGKLAADSSSEVVEHSCQSLLVGR